jgi:hypothetical protein
MVNDQNPLEMPSGDILKDSDNNADGYSRVAVAAHRLAIRFTEDTDLPVRYRKASSSAGSRKFKADSDLEQRFKVNVRNWTQLIKTMLAKINKLQAWRFIDISPEVGPTVRRLTDSEDFSVFTDYLILRRDKEKCSADELGGLALLSVAFQREIERRMERKAIEQKEETS